MRELDRDVSKERGRIEVVALAGDIGALIHNSARLYSNMMVAIATRTHGHMNTVGLLRGVNSVRCLFKLLLSGASLLRKHFLTAGHLVNNHTAEALSTIGKASMLLIGHIYRRSVWQRMADTGPTLAID